MTENFRHPTAATVHEVSAVTSAPGERFERVGKRQWGYKPQDVDAFLSHAEAQLHHSMPGQSLEVTSQGVREIVFGRARGGYQPAAVDAALDHIENTVARRENHEYIAAYGRQSWEEEVTAISDVIFGRLERADRKRFRSPSGSSTRGYAMADVDALCHEVMTHLGTAEGVHPDRVRSAVFGPAVGSRAYEEQQVDAFLDKLVQLLLALR